MVNLVESKRERALGVQIGDELRRIGGDYSRLQRLFRARGVKLHEWRKLQGHSMAGLARAIGVHQNTIANWELGETTIPHWAILKLVDMGWSKKEAMLDLGANNG